MGILIYCDSQKRYSCQMPFIPHRHIQHSPSRPQAPARPVPARVAWTGTYTHATTLAWHALPRAAGYAHQVLQHQDLQQAQAQAHQGTRMARSRAGGRGLAAPAPTALGRRKTEFLFVCCCQGAQVGKGRELPCHCGPGPPPPTRKLACRAQTSAAGRLANTVASGVQV